MFVDNIVDQLSDERLTVLIDLREDGSAFLSTLVPVPECSVG